MTNWDSVYHQVVDGNWTLLAAFAWKSYLEFGRGVVMVQVEQMVQAAQDTEELDVQMTYLPGSDAARLTSDTAEFVANYDPESEVVILFTGLDWAGNLAYRCKAGAGPLPPEAFRLYDQRADPLPWRLQ